MSARHHVVAQTKPSSFNCVDYLTGQNQFPRAFFSNYQGQKNRGHRRKHAELDLRLTKTRAIGSDHDIARGNEFTATAKRGPVYKRNRRLRNLFQLTKDRV